MSDIASDPREEAEIALSQNSALGEPRGRRRALNPVAAPAPRGVRRQRRSASQPAFTTPRSGLRIT